MSFDPDQSQAPSIRVVRNALLVPFGAGPEKGICRPAGVYDARGEFVESSLCWRRSGMPVTSRPEGEMPEKKGRRQRGTWLFGGMAYRHFGHFLCEATGRLWAQDHFDQPIDGVVYLPKLRRGKAEKFLHPALPWARICGAQGKITAFNDPTRFQQLIVPPQSFGTGDMIAGQPEFRRFISENCGRDIAPSGAEKIYISRSALFLKRGRYFGEALIEDWLRDEGYEIYHPQAHPIADQIAQYKAARVILSSDSSALHLAAFFARQGDKVGIIIRRPGAIVTDFITQYAHFSGVVPLVLQTLTGRNFQIEGTASKQTSELYAELDLAALGAGLAGGGFIANPSRWMNLTDAELEAERQGYEARLRSRIVPV